MEAAPDIEKALVSAERLEYPYADTPLKYARVDPEKRQNLALNLKEESAAGLIDIASAFCRK